MVQVEDASCKVPSIVSGLQGTSCAIYFLRTWEDNKLLHILAGMSCMLHELMFVAMQKFTEKSMDFQNKIIERSGLGDETYLPNGGSLPHILLPQTPVLLLISCSIHRAFTAFLKERLCLCNAAVHAVPASISLKAAREEAEMVMFDSVREVLASCNLKPRQARLSSCSCSARISLPKMYICLLHMARERERQWM